jgi:hypothetical protein
MSSGKKNDPFVERWIKLMELERERIEKLLKDKENVQIQQNQ